MSSTRQAGPRPWVARRPQNLVVSAILIVLAAALVWQALAFVSAGTGGVVPYFMLTVAPALAVYYTWYLTIHDFPTDPGSGPE